jgi:hypothetical protein
MLSQEEKRPIQAKLPAGTRALVLETLVWPNELLRMVAGALGETTGLGRMAIGSAL